jgi:hypothetical protein
MIDDPGWERGRCCASRLETAEGMNDNGLN